jgi:hypothetical protein
MKKIFPIFLTKKRLELKNIDNIYTEIHDISLEYHKKIDVICYYFNHHSEHRYGLILLNDNIIEFKKNIRKSKEKISKYLFITNWIIEKHINECNYYLDKKDNISARLKYYEEQLKMRKKPKGQKFIPILDPYGEENWED